MMLKHSYITDCKCVKKGGIELKKMIRLFLSFSLILLLAACSEDVTQYEAKASNFEDVGFVYNNDLTIVVIGEELVIFGFVSKYDPERKTIIDKLSKSANAVQGEFNEKRYKNVKIKTKKDKYYITADDGLSLEFQKIGERIIVDEVGAEYFTNKYPEK